MQELLDAGADPNATTNDGQKETLLQRTIRLYPEFASMILNHPKINIHATNDSGKQLCIQPCLEQIHKLYKL